MFLLLNVFLLPAVLVHCADKTVNLFITAPKSLEAVNGSCLMIPCRFRPASGKKFDNKRKLDAVWIKDDSTFQDHPERIVFNNSNAVDYPYISIIGDLKERNCTTKFNRFIQPLKNTKLFFRIENKSFKATASLNPVEITLKDSPPRPTLNISGDVKELKEKESVTISCSAPTPCPHFPPQLTWSLQQDAHSQTEENTDGTLSTKIQQTITLSDQHDGFKLSCSAVYPVDGGKHVKTAVAELTLNVSYAPKDTSASISPSGLVSAGSWVNLSCSSRGKPAVSYTWFKISDHGAVRVFEGDFYSFNVTDGGVYYCVAENDLGNQTSKQLFLTVSDLCLHQNTMIGVVIGIILLICLLLSICTFMCWRRGKNKISTVQVAESQTGKELAVKEPAEKPQEEGENLHYGEINFSKHKPEPSSKSEIRSKQEDTVYAEVKASQPANGSTHTADHPEDLYSLYAQVKTK